MNVKEFVPVNEASAHPQILFLHGFPGVRSRQNRDIAEKVSSLLMRATVVALYNGLGQSPGEFSFQVCLQEVEALFLKLSNAGPIDLVGHSWGGFQAIRLAALYPARVRKLVLLSPLLKFFPLDVCVRSFAETARDNPSLNLGNTEARAQEFCTIGRDVSVMTLIPQIPTRISVLVLQASDDLVTPGSVSKPAFEARPSTQYEIFENDHSFLKDRDQVAERIARFL